MRPSPGYPPATPEHAFFNKIGGGRTLDPRASLRHPQSLHCAPSDDILAEKRGRWVSYIIHINGWPGAGKRTIAHCLATQLDARLLDNHVLLNPAEALFKRDDPLHPSLRREVRRIVFAHAVQLDLATSIVATDALSTDADDIEIFEDIAALAEARRARLIPVVIDLTIDENVRRLSTPNRSEHRKLTRPEVLRQLRNDYALFYAPGAIELNVSTLSAAEAASLIRQTAGL